MTRHSCRQCGHDLRPGWKHCPSCGAPVVPVCGGCGGETEADWKVCPFCGYSLRPSGEAREEPQARRPGPAAPRLAGTELIPSRGNAVTTWHLARAVAERVGDGRSTPVDTVFRVYDGFREYVLNPSHYRPGGALKLVIPYFGIFSLHRRRGGRGVMAFCGRKYRIQPGYRLGFRLSPRAEASHYDKHRVDWTRMADRVDPRNLSVQRRTVLFVSEESGVDLATADLVLTETYRQIIDLLLRRGHDVTFYRLGRFGSPRGFRVSEYALAALADGGKKY